MKNNIGKTENCIGQKVINKDGQTAIIIKYQNNLGQRPYLWLKYDDGVIQKIKRPSVIAGRFKKPVLNTTKQDLKSGWKKINDDYIISQSGIVKALTGRYAGKIITTHTNSTGYSFVFLYDKKTKQKTLKLIHRLMAEVFIRPLHNGEEVNHIDGDRTNNNLYNLQITSRPDNNKQFFDISKYMSSIEVNAVRQYCAKNSISLFNLIGMSIKNFIKELNHHE